MVEELVARLIAQDFTLQAQLKEMRTELQKNLFLWMRFLKTFNWSTNGLKSKTKNY